MKYGRSVSVRRHLGLSIQLLAQLSVGLSLCALLASSARAQDLDLDAIEPGPELKAVRLMVLRVSGPRAWGTKALERKLRAELKRSELELVRPAKLSSKASDAKAAKAGREAGADYVLRVSLSRKKWLYTATARLIRSSDGAEQMSFRSQYYKPKTEASDRGGRIASTTLKKLSYLIGQGLAPAEVMDRLNPPTTGAPANPEPSEATPPSDGGPPATTEPTEAPPVAKNDPDAIPPWSDEPETSAPPPKPASEPKTAASPPEPESTTAEVLSRPETQRPHAARISLTAGAGLLRTYALSASGLERSSLSYQLDPRSLVELRGELPFGSSGLGLDGRIALSTVGYSLPEDEEVGGWMLDGRLQLHWKLVLDSQGALELIPRVGARWEQSGVDAHAPRLVLDSRALRALAGAALRIYPVAALELELGGDGGAILMYDESPGRTGASDVGISAGADLAVRVWVLPELAVTLDSRFDYAVIGFTGAAERTAALDERDVLTDAQLEIEDLRASLGLTLKL